MNRPTWDERCSTAATTQNILCRRGDLCRLAAAVGFATLANGVHEHLQQLPIELRAEVHHVRMILKGLTSHQQDSPTGGPDAGQPVASRTRRIAHAGSAP